MSLGLGVIIIGKFDILKKVRRADILSNEDARVVSFR